MRVKDPSGKEIQVLIPGQHKDEKAESFEHRKNEAKTLASTYQIGGELVARWAEKNPEKGDTTENAFFGALEQNQIDLEAEESFLESIKHMPRTDSNKAIFDRITLNLMKYRAEERALKSFGRIHPNAVDFESPEGNGITFNLDERSRLAPQVIPDASEST